jgi:purine-binding chemotaxis protein CheW
MTNIFCDSKDKTKEKNEHAGKYLTFALEQEEYGIKIEQIKEIIGMMNITSVPQTDEYMKGVINLRGKVIPVIDLRLKFGIQAMDYTERSCIIVVEVENQHVLIPIGLIVDAVSDVSNIKTDEIGETPTFGEKLETDYILGMAKKEDGVKILLDITKVLTSKERPMKYASA